MYLTKFPHIYIYGWVDLYEGGPQWYGRTSGRKDIPPARAQFDTEQEAKDFVQLMSALEHS